ncbi:hypothetical protein [Chitinimonas sp. JJ19]|uniref:hypothetical protein n=1 Tax=Chitinimonas sp. JJ19 TaxID=3109352 RepID=UPI0030031803
MSNRPNNPRNSAPVEDLRAAAEALFAPLEGARSSNREREAETTVTQARAAAEALFDSGDGWRSLQREREAETHSKLDRLREKRELMEAAEKVAARYGMDLADLLAEASKQSEDS